MPAPRVFLGLGSNLGDREAALARAAALLGGRGFRTMARSSLHLTEPVGGPPQGWFLNAVLQGETALTPGEPGLILPHPRRHERFFVLVPLVEVAPEVRDPVLGLTVEEMPRRCGDAHEVRRHAAPAR